MANIMLNEVCNLSCPYCFADKYVNKGSATDITYKNFKKAVDWVNFSSDADGVAQRIGLIGGEPLLHHRFTDLVGYALSQRRPGQEIIVFTNGIKAGEFAEYFAKNSISLLINLNSPKDIGEEKYKKVCESLAILRKKGVDFSLGINLYDPDMDFTFLTDLVEEYAIKNVRVGLICPNTPERKIEGSSAYFEKIEPAMIRLAEELAPLGCGYHLDCQVIPTCYIEKDYPKIDELERKHGVVIGLKNEADCNNCHPVIDILTDLKVARCFGMSAKDKTYPMEMFGTEMEANDFFKTQYDNLCQIIPANQRCLDKKCKEMYFGRCQGGCLAFKEKAYSKMVKALGEAFTKQ